MNGIQRVHYRLLPCVPAFHHVHAIGATIFGDLRLHPLHLRFAYGDVNRRHTLDCGKRAQRMNQYRDPVERKELLWLRTGHTRAQSRSGKNCEYLHNSRVYSFAAVPFSAQL